MKEARLTPGAIDVWLVSLCRRTFPALYRKISCNQASRSNRSGRYIPTCQQLSSRLHPSRTLDLLPYRPPLLLIEYILILACLLCFVPAKRPVTAGQYCVYGIRCHDQDGELLTLLMTDSGTDTLGWYFSFELANTSSNQSKAT
jgi:hypothetical protein